MKVTDITNIKTTSSDETEVKVYDANSIRFIHSYNKDSQMLSISSMAGDVDQSNWIFGVIKIMKLKLEDVIIQKRKSGVMIVTEKPDHYPKVANCTF